MDFIKQLINGLQIGSIYALVSLGYTMVYGIVKLINFAHGDIIMVGAYVAYICIGTLTSMGLPLYLAVIPAIIFCSLLGILIEKIAYRPMRNSARISSLITAIGVSLLLQNAFMLIFSPNPRPFDTVFPSNPIQIGDLTINISTIITILVSVAIMILLELFLTKSRAGKAMVAVSEDFSAAQLVGINVDNTISMTFAIGSALAAIASILYVSSYPQITPTMGSMLGLKAFVAAVLGGIGIIPGAMIGGFVIGIVEALTKAYISTELADAVVFGILIVVLLFKPEGIFGMNKKEKV
ncbi:MAG: branched-chain amino acid ABC transporter permease [Peptostreptococcaceae bacterium]|jgi:branched-chain amino acid ABC superfamily ATP binding cassette transporter, membrane protein|nr:branched-chain amino acid ABC transporter permease [Peptostreptococcaceae bacterium]